MFVTEEKSREEQKEITAFIHARERLQAARMAMDVWDTKVVQRMSDLTFVTRQLQKAQETYIVAEAHFKALEQERARQAMLDARTKKLEEEDKDRLEWKLRVRP